MRISRLFPVLVFLHSVVTVLAASPSYQTLRDKEVIHGFRTTATYLDDNNRVMGARFIHERTGFTLDLLEIQSVPQTFTWVTTFPTSDMGEPHTQEHLLLGKGNIGRAHAGAEAMRLVHSSAYTMQWRTCYHFNTNAGTDAFFAEFDHSMDALLHPDYSDEEIRREVRNFGISEKPDRTLQLEEKGTVYNEMVTSMDLGAWRLWKETARTIYGPDHPLAYNSGGDPAALRRLQPADIRRFHADHYFLGNMGAVISLGREVPLADALARLDGIFLKLEPVAVKKPITKETALPPAKPAPAGSIVYVDYPFKDAQQPGDVWLQWPADRSLSAQDRILCELFLDNLAGDPTTNFYKRFIDSRTREYEFGAQGVGAGLDDDLGAPITIQFSDVPAKRRNDADLADIRHRVLAELGRISAWPDGSPELKEFNARLLSRIVARRRDAAKFINTPPGFGGRLAPATWMTRLHELNRAPGFAKSISQSPDLRALEEQLARPVNLWRDRLSAWRLTGVEPYVMVSRPEPKLLVSEQEARQLRLTAETERLAQNYGVTDGQAALRAYRKDYDAATAVLQAAEKAVPPPKFIDQPPLSLDDQLDYKVTSLAGNVPLVSSTFESMSGGYVGLALRCDAVPEEQLGLLALLPDLLTKVGVIEDGKPVSFETMSERLRNEVLGLIARFRTDPRTGRVELVVRGAGIDTPETRRAIGWMKQVVSHPDWRAENLPRLRDLADQTWVALRSTMQGREEDWVQGPANALRLQQNPAYLATSSFLTREHLVFRLRWRLKDAGTGEERAKLTTLLLAIGQVRGNRDTLKAQLTTLVDTYGKEQSEHVRAVLADVAKDLDQVMGDLPDSNLERDWTALCADMGRDLAIGPDKTLQELTNLRQSLLTTGGARLFTIASGQTQTELAGDIAAMVRDLKPASFVPVTYRPVRRIEQRLTSRDPDALAPKFLGLVNANSQGGVFLNSAPALTYEQTSPDALLDYLSTNLYGGGGAQGVFMKTWAAGLAYSNGISVSPSIGRLSYYAERTPELPVTLKFVIDYLSSAPRDDSLIEPAIANVFGSSRASGTYEARGEAMAQDLADGLPPETIARFRQGILDLRKRPDLGDELFSRTKKNYARALPGMAGFDAKVPEGIFFVIGPEKQFTAYETYLRTAVDPQSRLHRLYPRDFWLAD